MKVLSLFVILSFSAHASANDTLNKLKGMLGDASTSTSQTTEAAEASSLDVSSLVSMVSENRRK